MLTHTHACIIPTQIGARSNGAKNRPVYSALKPVYVLATFLDQLNAVNPAMYKLDAHKMFRDPSFRLQPNVDVRVADKAKQLFVKTLQKRACSQEWWENLRDLCAPLLVLPPNIPLPKKRPSRTKTASQSRSRTRSTTKRVPPVPKKVDKVKLLEQELLSTRNELAAARNAATAAQQAAEIATAAVESLTQKINTPTQVTPQKHNKHKHPHKHKRSRETETDASPSSTDSEYKSPVQPPRWFRKYTKRMRHNMNTNTPLGGVPMVMNNMCVGSPSIIPNPNVIRSRTLMFDGISCVFRYEFQQSPVLVVTLVLVISYWYVVLYIFMVEL